MIPDYFRHVLAPGLLAHHQQSFHAGPIHYHFTPTGGTVLLVVLIVITAGVAVWKLLFR